MAPHAWRPPKRRRPNDPDPTTKPEQNKAVPKFAYIRAYEANLNYDRPGPHEQRSATGIGLEADGVAKEGAREGGLIKWAGTFDDEHVEGAGEEREVWADRYDIIHLLPTLPAPSTPAFPIPAGRNTSPAAPVSPSSSASSWPDEPSDEEALFSLSGDEAIAAYQREKRRKWVDELRERRMRELGEGDAEGSGEGGVEEQVEEDIQPSTLALMHHTALSLFRSPNPVQLEAKIFAHHSSDARFAFLRAASSNHASRLAKAWDKAKYDAKVKLGIVKVPPKPVQIIGLGYGSSDSESEGSDGEGDDEAAEGDGKGTDDMEQGPGAERAEEPDGLPPTEPPPSPPPPPGSTPPPPPMTDLLPVPPAESADGSVGQAATDTSTEDRRDEGEQQKQAERKARMEAWKRDKERKRREALHDAQGGGQTGP